MGGCEFNGWEKFESNGSTGLEWPTPNSWRESDKEEEILTLYCYFFIFITIT